MELEPFTKKHKNLFVQKKTLSAILTCHCARKFIKTRKNQSECLYCIWEKEEEKKPSGRKKNGRDSL